MIGKLIKLFKKIILLLNVLKHYHNNQTYSSTHVVNPRVIISYDDGKVTDYIRAYPFHKETGTVAEICVISSQVDAKGYLTQKQLQDFQEEGLEIVSHSRNHNPLCDSFLTQAAFKGDKTIYVEHGHRFQKNADCILGFGCKKERVKVAYSAGDCLHLESHLSLGHKKYASFRISDEQLQEEVLGSKNDLEEMGIKVRNFTYPYNAFSRWSIKVVEKYYESARAERLVPIGRGRLNKNIINCFNKYFLYSYPLEVDMISESDIVKILDKARKRGGACIFYAHTSSVAFSIDLLKFLFKEAGKRSIPFETRSMVH